MRDADRDIGEVEGKCSVVDIVTLQPEEVRGDAVGL